MIARLRAHRHRPWVATGLGFLLVAWLTLFIGNICLMPMSGQDADATAEACPEHSSHHPNHATDPAPDCSLKPCAEAQAGSLNDQNFVSPGLAVLLPMALWVMGLSHRPPSRRPHFHWHDPPDGRRIPLIYRYCSLLI